MQVDERPDVTLAPSPLGVHKLFRLLVTKFHIISAAAPLPLDSLPGGGGRRWFRRRSVPGCLTAALQEAPHAAGLGHRVGHASSRNGIHERCLSDIYSAKGREIQAY